MALCPSLSFDDLGIQG